MSQRAAVESLLEQDGRRDFHFLFGRWRIANRKLANVLEQGCTEWFEFEAYSHSQPILGGLGNIDLYTAPHFPGRGHFEGAALRLFDPETQLWTIWWMSTAQPGELDEPVVGRFIDRYGRFECDDVLGGRPVKVRYEWTDITPTSARWEQAFSFDGGATFETNWIQQLSRDS